MNPSVNMPARAASTPGSELVRSEDWWAVWLGFALIGLAVVLGHRAAAGLEPPFPPVPKLGDWTTNPFAAFSPATAVSAVVLILLSGGLTALATWAMGRNVVAYLGGFIVVCLLALAAQTLGTQQTLDAWHLGYALWALLFGLVIANTVGTPSWLLAGTRSELFIKIGLVILGCEILFGKLVALGGPGLVVAWMVTPVVIVSMWLLGTRVLRLGSPALVIVIACATSVCGVSAAIAAAAASRAKREELTLAVGMTMIFTVGMMVGMPALCAAIGLDVYVAGAWIGGTVDSTGAVVASGAILGEEAGNTAAVVKMIQNALIGLIAFLIALYWVTVIERDPAAPAPSPMEIWHRFPKFVLGFLAASLLFSFAVMPVEGESTTDAIIGVTKGLRGWWFALAFTAIGLESNFRSLAAQLVGGKPIWLYVIGQSFNVLLTLLAAWLAFGGVLFPSPG